MPEMSTLQLNGVSYDVRDPTKAPAGYGLGTPGAKIVSTPDEAVNHGFYNVNNDNYDGDGTFKDWRLGWCSLLVERRNDVICQTAKYYNEGMWFRTSPDGGATWNPWEWVNPPMTLGTEYRTTERYQGKAVYTQLFEFGALPNKTDKSCNLPTAAKATDMVRYEGKMKYGDRRYDLRGVNGIAIAFLNCSPTSNAYFWITTNEDMSAYTATIQVWYTRD